MGPTSAQVARPSIRWGCCPIAASGAAELQRSAAHASSNCTSRISPKSQGSRALYPGASAISSTCSKHMVLISRSIHLSCSPIGRKDWRLIGVCRICAAFLTNHAASNSLSLSLPMMSLSPLEESQFVLRSSRLGSCVSSLGLNAMHVPRLLSHGTFRLPVPQHWQCVYSVSLRTVNF